MSSSSTKYTPPKEQDTFTVIRWPASQAYMDEPWFDTEAFLADVEMFGPSAYAIPTQYVKSNKEN